jgi:hypothetical protein
MAENNFYGRMNLTPMEVESPVSIPKAVQPKPRPFPEALVTPPRVDLTPLAIRQFTEPGLRAIAAAWRDFQSDRSRDAIYDYLKRVFTLVTNWKDRGQTKDRMARLVKTHRVDAAIKTEPFSVVIYCTSDPHVVDAKTRSKWSRVLRYAQRFNKTGIRVKTFIKSKGGINACASRFAARLGRGKS